MQCTVAFSGGLAAIGWFFSLEAGRIQDKSIFLRFNASFSRRGGRGGLMPEKTFSK